MAELTGKAVSELPESTTINNSALVVLSENGSSKKMTLATLVGDFFKKSGGTITGNSTISNTSPGIYLHNTNYNVTDTSYTQSNSVGVRLQDVNSKNVAIMTDRYVADGKTGLWLSGWKIVNGSDISNSLYLFVNKYGERVVEVSEGAPWRKAIGLCYTANETYTISVGVNLPAIANGNSTTIYMSAHVDKSMENISTVTATSLNGWIAGPSGALNNSTTSVQFVGASGYTVACTKLSNHMVRIQLTKSSAFANSVNNGSVVFFGTLTLKFT